MIKVDDIETYTGMLTTTSSLGQWTETDKLKASPLVFQQRLRTASLLQLASRGKFCLNRSVPLITICNSLQYM